MNVGSRFVNLWSKKTGDFIVRSEPVNVVNLLSPVSWEVCCHGFLLLERRKHVHQVHRFTRSLKVIGHFCGMGGDRKRRRRLYLYGTAERSGAYRAEGPIAGPQHRGADD